MRYELMFPDQIRRAIEESWPVILPIGVLEYHGEHCAVGVDGLVVVRAFELLEKEMNIVILPSFYYGAASYAVAAPENTGSIHVDSEVLNLFGKQLFAGLLRVGFRNIHGFIHHQSENFVAGMPTDLAFKLAARQSIFEFLEKQNGEGWWGKPEMENYYAVHENGKSPFNWIQFHPLMGAESFRRFPADHAGKQETSLMLAFCPDGVDMRRLSNEHWYCRDAAEANQTDALAMKDIVLKELRELLQKKE